MSGLLSGIRLIPRAERDDSDSADSDSSSSSSSSSRREKKSKKKTKKKSKKSKSKKSKKRNYSSGGDDADTDMHKLLEEEEGRQRQAGGGSNDALKWMYNKPSESHRDTTTTNSNSNSRKINQEMESDFDVKQYLKNNVNMDVMMRQISTENEEDSNDGRSQGSNGDGSDDEDPWGKGSAIRKRNRRVNNDDYSSEGSDADTYKKRKHGNNNSGNSNQRNDNSNDALSSDEPNMSVAQQLRAKLQANKVKALSAQDGTAARCTDDDAAVIIMDDYRSIALKRLQNQHLLQQKEDLARGSKAGKLKTNKEDLSESDIRDMVAAERLGGEDMDKVFEENILRLGGRYKGTELGGKGAQGGDSAGADEDDDVDMRLFQRADNYLTDTQAMRRNIIKTLGERKRMNTALERCQYCHMSAAFVSYLTLSVGEHTMLRLKPDALSLSEGHCEIVPLEHIGSTIQCEEEVWTEIERYKSCLRRMCEAEEKVAIFTEVAMSFGKRPHSYIDCIPIKRLLVEDAKMRILQALNSCDEEWGTHKKIMHTSAEKPLQVCVPKRFQYVYFEVEEKVGCYHVIDREDTFTPLYCLEVINGLTKKDINFKKKGLSHSHSGEEENNRRSADIIARRYGQYDWTQYV